MKADLANKSLLERLRACPKLECNFWRKLNSSYDGDVSDITFEEGNFWKNGGSSLLYLAAKRFESSVSENYEQFGELKGSYDEDRLSELPYPHDEVDDSFSDSRTSLTPTKNDFEDLALRNSIPIPSEGPEVRSKTDKQKELNGGIPSLESISDKENSFSSSSTNTASSAGYEHDCFVEKKSCDDDTEGMEHLYENLVNASSLTSSFNTSNNANNADSCVFEPHSRSFPLPGAHRSQDCSNKFADVKTAKSLNLFVDEYPQTSFFSLLDSLQSNHAIEKIVVFRKRTTNEEIRTRTLEDMDNLFHVIRDLSKSLVELIIWNFHPEDLSSLCLGVADHPSIGYLQLHMEHGTLDQQAVETIASMPSLVTLDLEVNESFPVWSLLESDSLVMLGVVSTKFDFEPSDVLRLAGRIRTNSVLQVLDLEPRIPSWCIGAVMASLRFSHTSKLETFQFSCRNDNEDQGDACMAEILKTIEYETPLRVLWNHSYESFAVSEEVRRRTMSAVSRNPSLEQFHLFSENKG